MKKTGNNSIFLCKKKKAGFSGLGREHGDLMSLPEGDLIRDLIRHG